MSKKRKKRPESHASQRASGAANLAATMQPLRKQGRGKRRDTSLYWIIGFVVIVVIAIIWAVRPKPPPVIAEPITSQEALLPLATPIRPMTVNFDPAFHADTVGPVTRVVWVDSNDPDQPRLVARIFPQVTSTLSSYSA